MDIYQRLKPAPLVLFDVYDECPGGLRPSSSLHLSYDSVPTTSGPWPLRHVLLCDCFGPRRSQACVPALGLAASASASHAIKQRRGSELQLEAVSSVGSCRAQPRSHQSWPTGSYRLGQAPSLVCVMAAHDAGIQFVYDHETHNLAIKGGKTPDPGPPVRPRVRTWQDGLRLWASRPSPWPREDGPVLASGKCQVQEPKRDRPTTLAQSFWGQQTRKLSKRRDALHWQYQPSYIARAVWRLPEVSYSRALNLLISA